MFGLYFQVEIIRVLLRRACDTSAYDTDEAKWICSEILTCVATLFFSVTVPLSSERFTTVDRKQLGTRQRLLTITVMTITLCGR